MCRSDKGGEMMAMITVTMVMAKTVATLDATTIAAIIQWIETNVKQKLPAEATLSVNLNITP